jgi:RHS repeat-associated protein
MRRYFSLQWLTGILLLFLINNLAWAGPAPTVAMGIDPPVVKALEGNKGQLKKDSIVVVEDAKFFNPAYNALLIKPYPVKNIISLEFNEQANVPIPGDFDTWVKVKITYTNADLSTASVDTVLYVGFTTAYHYRNRYSYILQNAYRVEVKILDMKSDVNPEIWKALRVVNQLQSFPQYHFDCTTNAVNAIHDSAWTPNTQKDELPVYWAPSIGADEYDLEWTYIDYSALASGIYSTDGSPNAALIFDNNASRVTITGTYYKIPLIYDNNGHLFFRVRPVQWQANGGRTEAHWSSDFTGGLGKFDYNGNERPLNWQATTTFAEEGKRKTVVQYYDGSLRARQTVTKDNSTENTIVAESFYDYQGRPVIQVLPAPTLNSVIGYSKNFNRGLNASTGYDKSLFDTLASADMYCNTSAPAMDSSGGAAQYYSPANPLANSGFHKYIPDAKGYPFTEVEYMQDNTGRISRQSGVGETYRIGSGHETRYFYGTPDQCELDALFGTEVGHYSHYFKTMVRDANGQYSVSYTDMRGRTIATALAGATPDSIKLDTLSSYRSAMLTERLSDPAATVIKDLVMESKKGLLVSKAGDHIFTYKLGPQSLAKDGCAPSQVCYECLYDLQITITDDCNNQKLGGASFDTVVHNFQIAAIDTSCKSNSGGFSFSFIKFLPEGSYEVTKKLSVSRYGLDYYRDSIFMKTNTCKNLQDFIQEQRQLLAGVLQCRPTCQGCNDSLGTWEQFRERFRLRSGIAESDMPGYENMALDAYNKAKEDCNALCDSAVSEFNDIRRNMLMDMTPSSGQYANLDRDTSVLSIFFAAVDGVAPDTTAKYTQVTNYKDANGNPDLVYDEAVGKAVPPQELSPEVFAQKFKLSWAEALLPSHPEYWKLQQYEMLKSSHEWDKRFAETDTYAEALAKGYLNPTRHSDIPARFTGGQTDIRDPLDTFQNSAFHSALKDSILNYRKVKYQGIDRTVSLYAVASMTVMCKEGTNESCPPTYINIDNAFNTTNMCAGELDMAWRGFRQMYLDIKRQITNKWINDQRNNSLTAAVLMAKGYAPHFSDAPELNKASGAELPQNTTQAQNEVAQQMAGYYDANCRAYATQWIQQLGSCYPADSLTNVIIPRLVQVCKEGSDADHPYGASSVKPSSTNTFRSFEEVINNYNQTHGITDYINCNAWKITAPKPYDRQSVFGNKPVYTKPNDCECSSITAYNNKYRSSTGYSSFANYLKKVYNTNVSDSALNLMLGLCNVPGVPAVTCSYVSSPLFLPPAFQCYTGEVCIECEQFRAADNAFRAQFPGIYPADGTKDDVQILNNQLYEDFMNNRLGFSKRVDEYLAFARSCGMPVDSTSIALTQIKNNYINNVANNTPVFRFLGNYGRYPDYEIINASPEIIHDGIAQAPARYQDSAVIGYSHFQLLWPRCDWQVQSKSHYTIEARVKMTYVPGQVVEVNTSNFYAYYRVTNTSYGYVVSGHSIGYGNGEHDNSGEYPLDTLANGFNDWQVLKLRYDNGKYQFYIAGKLVKEYTSDSRVPFIGGMGFGFLGHTNASVDWFKIYDENDVLRYVEDFTDTDIAKLPPDLITECAIQECKQSFTDYFNQQKGTGYTFNQVDSIYRASGIVLDVCTPGNSNPNVSPEQLVKDFNANYKASYGANFRFITQEGESFTDLHHLAREGRIQLPDTIRARPGDWYNPLEFTANGRYFKWTNGYAIEYRMKFLQDLLGGNVLYINFNSDLVGLVISRYGEVTIGDSTYGPGIYLSGIKTNDSNNRFGYDYGGALFQMKLITSDMNALLDWNNYKVQIEFNSAALYYNDALIIRVPRDPQPLSCGGGSGLGFRGRHGAVDWIKLYDENNQVRYFEDFLDPDNPAVTDANYRCGDPYPDCQTAFAQYYNQQYGTNYTFNQLEALYNANHIPLAVCGISNTSTCTFQKTYGGLGIDVANDMQKTADQGHIMAGYTTSFGNGGFDGYVVKTDNKGNVLWSKTYGAGNHDVFNKIKPTSDGGYIAVGYTQSFHQSQKEIFVVKMDASGNVIWSKGLAQNSGNGEIGFDVIQTSDGGYVVVGTYDYSPQVADWEVVRLAADGTVIWGKQLGSTSSDQALGVIEDNDTLVVTGIVHSLGILNPPTFYDGCIIKMNKANGNVIWVKTYDVNTPKSSWFNGIFKTGAGYRLTVTASDDFQDNNMRLATLDVDKNGNVTRLKRVPAARNNVNSLSMYPTADGGYIAAQGHIGANNDISLSKADVTGNVQWTNLVKQNGNQYINKIVEDNDGNFTGAGSSDADMLLFTVNNAGKSNCEDSAINTGNDSIGYKSYNRVFNTNSSLTFSNTAISITGLSAATSVNNLCITGSCFVTSRTLCGRAEPVFPPMTLEDIDNCSDSAFFIASKAQELYRVYIDSLKGNFDGNYIARCLAAYKVEQFTVRHQVNEFHHTLYYYDQAGNLLKTVPPAGVRANYDSLWLDSVGVARAAESLKTPKHQLVTQYRYNTLNQVVSQQSPDGGKSGFWYDRLGRLVISQNARQKAVSTTESGRQYSYTLYDVLGRITEVGQLANAMATAMADTISRKPASLNNWLNSSAANKEQITQTVYDLPYNGFTGISPAPINQYNLRNRVSYTTFTSGSNPAQYNNGTFYSYDIHGNVDTLLQDYGNSGFTATANIMNAHNMRFKTFVYDYDLISGKVNRVQYQPDYTDGWIHRYSYDAENRLTKVETSADDYVWETDARYQYYKHGPLARMVLGDQQVQGIDYAYTLQGWLKGMNSIALDAANDLGNDGLAGGFNQYVAKDALGFNLNYFTGDYKSINAGVNPFPGTSGYLPAGAYKPLYNGNISSIAKTNAKLGEFSWTFGGTVFYNYGYDQLNRLTKMDAFNGFRADSNSWKWINPLDIWRERITYDGNGNIQTYLRNGADGGGNPIPMDRLTYNYEAGTNKLRRIRDSVPSGAYPNIKEFSDLDDQPENNYTYDQIGNLIKDSSEGITSIKWSVYGKILEINKQATSPSALTRIVFTYDAQGNRIGKTTEYAGNNYKQYDWYVRDAQGNVIAIYSGNGGLTTDLGSVTPNVSEWHIYGSSLIGTYNNPLGMHFGPGRVSWQSIFNNYWRGLRRYQLSNHLGNVEAVVTDKKFGVVSDTNSSLIAYYKPDIYAAQDYYPFGWQMPGRGWQVQYYRYGFNGKEQDNELKGFNGEIDYGMRVYDPRVGRFLSVDPLSKSYPWNSPYSYAENDVLRNVDLDGGEKKHYLLVWDEKQKNATLVFSRSEDFTETTTKWTPTVTNWIKTTTTTVKNPRVEYVVHGTVAVPMSADGMFKDDIQAVTWTFKTAEEMFGKETARREHAEKGPYAWGPSHDWSYASSDQRFSIMGEQMLMYGIEAQAQKTIYSPNVYLAALKTITEKSARLKIFMARLSKAPSVSNPDDAIKLINNTLDGVEDDFSGIPKAAGEPTRDDGRMYGVLDDQFVTTMEDGSKVARTRGNRIVLDKDGGFQIKTKDGSKTLFTKPGAQKQ